MDIAAEVLLELTEMKKLGLRVPKKAFENAEKLEYRDYPCMSVSDIADMMISLS